MPEIKKSAEHLRIEGLVAQFPEGTRKGDDARARLAEIQKKFAQDEQRNRGVGQFIQGPSLKEKQEQRRAARR